LKRRVTNSKTIPKAIPAVVDPIRAGSANQEAKPEPDCDPKSMARAISVISSPDPARKPPITG
jgi:hypothetical protein